MSLQPRGKNPDAARLAAMLFQRMSRTELDEKVLKFYPGEWDEYRATIARCGNPADQIANFERAKIILQPKQLEFSAWARRVDSTEHIEGEMGSPEVGMGGARGPGKSFGIFAQASVDDSQRYPGLKGLYLRKTGLRAREQLEDLIASVLRYVPHRYTQGLIRFPNNSQIIVGHFQTEKEALNYLGIEYDWIIIEEATTLTERVHKALRQSARTSKPGWRPRVYNSTNPLGVGHKYYKARFIDHERKHADELNRTRKFIFATVNDNKAVNDDYRGNLEELTGVERKAYLEGNWDVSAGAYFDQWTHDLHVVAPIQPLPQWKVWASMDYGFNHWNMIYLHAQTGDGVIYTFHELAHRKHYPSEIVPDLLAVLASYGMNLKRLDKFYAGADVFNKTGQSEKSIAEQYDALGIKLAHAETSAGSRVGGAHHIQKLLGQPERGINPTWFITSNCERLINCLPFLEVDANNPEDVLKVDADEKGVGGDDPYDAVRYGLFVSGTKKIEATKMRWT